MPARLPGYRETTSKCTRFAELDIALLSGQKELRRPRQSARQAIDFTYSALKSVSVAGVFDSRLRSELRAAVIEELRWFEQHAASRDRRGALYDTETSRRTGKFLGAAFVHETSRACEDRTEFVRSTVNGKDMISTQAILAEEQAILDGVRSGLGQLEPLISETDSQILPELVSSEAAADHWTGGEGIEARNTCLSDRRFASAPTCRGQRTCERSFVRQTRPVWERVKPAHRTGFGQGSEDR